MQVCLTMYDPDKMMKRDQRKYLLNEQAEENLEGEMLRFSIGTIKVLGRNCLNLFNRPLKSRGPRDHNR